MTFVSPFENKVKSIADLKNFSYKEDVLKHVEKAYHPGEWCWKIADYKSFINLIRPRRFLKPTRFRYLKLKIDFLSLPKIPNSSNGIVSDVHVE